MKRIAILLVLGLLAWAVPSRAGAATLACSSATTLDALATCIGASVSTAATPGRIERGNLVFDGIPVAANDEAGNLARYLESRNAHIADWLADGSLVISTRFGPSAPMCSQIEAEPGPPLNVNVTDSPAFSSMYAVVEAAAVSLFVNSRK